MMGFEQKNLISVEANFWKITALEILKGKSLKKALSTELLA